MATAKKKVARKPAAKRSTTRKTAAKKSTTKKRRTTRTLYVVDAKGTRYGVIK